MAPHHFRMDFLSSIKNVDLFLSGQENSGHEVRARNGANMISFVLLSLLLLSGDATERCRMRLSFTAWLEKTGGYHHQKKK